MNGKPKSYLINTYPYLIKEIDYIKNNDIKIDKIGTSSSIKIWWICNLGHSFYTSPNSRTKGTRCGYCTNVKVLKGFNDLESKFPEISKEWDYTKNNLKPQEVLYKTGKEFWWLCKNNHLEYRSVVRKTNSPKCKECSSLFFINPDFMSEWDWDKNDKEDWNPKRMTLGSNHKVWWLCDKGHQWMTSPNKRTGGNNCPYCSSKKILEGYNDLQSRFPELIEEWDFEKNYPKMPNRTFPGNVEKVWWRCKIDKNHQWQASPNKRTSSLRGCPRCSNSLIEMILFKELKIVFPEIINNYKIEVENFRIKNFINVDFYLNNEKVVIEYDGRKWHESEKLIKLDTEKTKILLNKNCKVIRLRDRDLEFLEIKDENLLQIQYKYGSKNALKHAIDEIINFLGQ